MRVTAGNKMRLLLRELAASNTVISLDDALWELRVLESPEAE